MADTLNVATASMVNPTNFRLLVLIGLVAFPYLRWSPFSSYSQNYLCIKQSLQNVAATTAVSAATTNATTNPTTAPTSAPTSTSCLLDGCYHVFIDAGSNRGVHGRFLFEPEQYPKSKFARKFRQIFGKGDRTKQNICVLALEPNPAHERIQKATASAYGFMGWRYHYLQVAVSDSNGSMTFYTNGDVAHGATSEYWGFGMKLRGNSTAVKVQMMDIVDMLNQNVFCRTIPEATPDNNGIKPRVFIKMDIEGSEYKVFRRMADAARAGILNVSKIHTFLGETHAKFAPLEVNGRMIHTREGLQREAMRLIDQLVSVGGPRFYYFDDEKYLHDGVRYPQPK